MTLMNDMSNMVQFVVAVSIPEERFATLASYYMQHILMKFGLCHLVVLDDGSTFKGAFIVMSDALNMNHDVFTKRNHKDLTVKYCHQFLNKSVTIAAEERGTNSIFVPVGFTVGYA